MKVVIVGGGFGGLAVARGLKKAPVEVTLVDRRNFHLFQPLLYQVATGGLSPANIAAPLRSILRGQKNARVLLGEAIGVDVEGRRLLLADGAALDYDVLVLATGSRHHYFGHPEWETVAPGLKTIEDALEMRRRLLLAFETAERLGPGEASMPWMTFVVVGGGPTGVELAGAIAEMAHHTLAPEFASIRPAEARVVLLEAVDRVLPAYPSGLSEKALRALEELGVEVRTGVTVEGIDEDGVAVKPHPPTPSPTSERGSKTERESDVETGSETEGEQTERIEAKTVLWAAGVVATPPGAGMAESLGIETDRAGRAKVNTDLSVPGHPEVFVIGDLALVEQDGKQVPAVAPTALQQGGLVARAIRARIEGKDAGAFRYRSLGMLATIGRSRAVADFGLVKLWGFPAWATWLFVHILNLARFENRLLVLVQWGWAYWTRGRSARLITGRTPPPAPPR
jgi:NADH dehydrogenase